MARNDPPSGAYRYADGVLTLNLRVQPGASRTGWAGWHGEAALKLRVAAPPVEGRANQACIRFLAKAARVPPSAVTILRGETGRDKLVRIEAVRPDILHRLQEQWAADA